MHPTKNDIPLVNRTKFVSLLNPLLSDAIDLRLQCKQAHWNVKGDNFIALHELFDQVATEVEGAVDMIAERIVQLGGTALGTAKVVAKQSRLREYPLNAVEEQEHVEALSSAIAAFNANSRQMIDETAGLGDAITADLLTEVTRGLDKQLWFIESHLRKASSRALKAGHA